MRMGIRTNGSVKPHASPVYDFAGADGENRAREFFELCTLAILTRRRWTFVLKWQLPAAMQCDAFRLREIVAASPVGCVVVRYETKDVTSGATIRRLAKFAVPENEDATERFDVETRNLAALKAMPVDVGRRASVETVLGHEAIVFDDDKGALSVEQLVESLSDDEKLDAIAKLVKEKIRAQLDALHVLDWGFVDIHPGNVVVVCDADGTPTDAWLIDYECLCRLGTSVAEKRILGRKEFVPRSYNERDARTSVAGDLESLDLVLAWILDVNAFRSSISSAQSGDSAAGEVQWATRKQRRC